MRNSVWIRSAIAAAVGLSTASALAAGDAGNAPKAGDWPRWLGPAGNGISAEKVADKWPADGPKKLWSAKVGKGFSSAVARDGKIYFFATDDGRDVLTCFDAATGTKAWSEGYAGAYAKDYPGARTTPAIDGDRIYTYGGAGQLVARELANGKQAWRLDVLKETGSSNLTWGLASSPLVHGDHVVVQSGGGGPIAVAVNKADGKVAWKSEATGLGGYAHVIAVDVGGKPQLIVFAGAGLFGLDPTTGKTVWKQPWTSQYDVSAATPVYDGKGHLFVTSGYGSGSGSLYELSATGAKKLWTKRELRCKFPAPILDGDTLYLVTDEGRGPAKASDWLTGKVLWEIKDAKLGFGGSLVRVGGDKLIAQAQTGELHLIEATPKAGKILSTFKPFTGDQIWSMPVVSNGNLYAKGPDELVCFELK